MYKTKRYYYSFLLVSLSHYRQPDVVAVGADATEFQEQSS